MAGRLRAGMGLSKKGSETAGFVVLDVFHVRAPACQEKIYLGFALPNQADYRSWLRHLKECDRCLAKLKEGYTPAVRQAVQKKVDAFKVPKRQPKAERNMVQEEQDLDAALGALQQGQMNLMGFFKKAGKA